MSKNVNGKHTLDLLPYVILWHCKFLATFMDWNHQSKWLEALGTHQWWNWHKFQQVKCWQRWDMDHLKEKWCVGSEEGKNQERLDLHSDSTCKILSPLSWPRLYFRFKPTKYSSCNRSEDTHWQPLGGLVSTNMAWNTVYALLVELHSIKWCGIELGCKCGYTYLMLGNTILPIMVLYCTGQWGTLLKLGTS